MTQWKSRPHRRIPSHNEGLKTRKRLWVGLGAFCLLALGVGWMARPEDVRPKDELAGIRHFHPFTHWEQGYGDVPSGTWFSFKYPATDIARFVPGKRLRSFTIPGTDDWIDQTDIELPSGKTALLMGFDGPFYRNGSALVVAPDTRPLYRRAWENIKHRLGL